MWTLLFGGGEDRIREPRGMTLETFQNILKSLKEAKAEELYITGGEPMLHPQVVDMCKSAKEMGFHVILVTNGTELWNEQKVNEIGPYIDAVEISIRSTHPNLHDELTLSSAMWGKKKMPANGLHKAGSFNRSVEALQTLSRMKHKYAYTIGVNHDLYETEEKFSGHGVLYEIARMLIEDKGIQLDEIYGQITSFSGRAARHPMAIKAKFGVLKPEHIFQALQDLKDLKQNFAINGGLTDDPSSIIPINQIPSDIREFVIAEKVPAFDPSGGLRNNVVVWKPYLDNT